MIENERIPEFYPHSLLDQLRSNDDRNKVIREFINIINKLRGSNGEYSIEVHGYDKIGSDIYTRTSVITRGFAGEMVLLGHDDLETIINSLCRIMMSTYSEK